MKARDLEVLREVLKSFSGMGSEGVKKLKDVCPG
jgi:hypothetical protein